MALVCAAVRASVLTGLLAGPLAGPLTGCASWPTAPTSAVSSSGNEPDPAEILVPEMRLVEAVERAERALAALARTLPAHDPSSALPPVDSVPEELRRAVTLDWTGPVEVLAADLARRVGYRFAQAGRPPARPLIVAVQAEGEPLIAVLRDAGLRAGAAATLTVDAAAQRVLLDWTEPSALAPERVR